MAHIPQTWLFQNFNFKIQGQGHGASLKSQGGCDILSTHIPFVDVNQSTRSLDTTI